MTPHTIEERAKALGLSVIKTPTDWLIRDDAKGEILTGGASRCVIAKWLDGAEKMARIMEGRLGAGL